MAAAVVHRWGGPEVLSLERVPCPRPGSAQILVRVEACSINYLDILVRRGVASGVLSLPHVPGCDIVGTVVGAGDDADRRLVGQRVVLDPALGAGVLGAECWGGLAEHVVAPATNAIPIPPNTAEATAYAAVPMAYGTARRMLFERGRLGGDETVVVLGAAGGVGVACAQLATLGGSRVIACSTSPEKRRLLAALVGCSTIDTSAPDLPDRVRDLTGRGADLVVDFLGRDTWPLSLRCVRRGGRIVTCGATTGYDAICDLRYVWSREVDILGSNGWTRQDLVALLALVEAGRLHPVVHATYPLPAVADAVAEVEERRVCGKVVVTLD